MLYITTSPLSLVSHHAWKQNARTPRVYRKVDSLALNDLLVQGSVISPAVVVIDAKSDKPPKEVMQSLFNTAYLCVSSTKYWESLIEEKPWIKQIVVAPELYRERFDKLPGLFADYEARESFWERFKEHPHKLDLELWRLFFKVSTTGEKVTEEFMDALYGGSNPDLFLSFKRHLGTPRGTAILRQMPESTLWTLLIGSDKKPAYIYYHLVGKNGKDGACPDLYHHLTLLQSVTKEGSMNLKIAAILFHHWVVSVGIKKVGKSLEFTPSIDELTKLNQLLN